MNHEAWGDQMASYMSKQVVAVTKGLINYLGHGHDQSKSEFGGRDDNGGRYKWWRLQMGARLWYCSLITLIMGVIKGSSRNGGRFHPSGKKEGGQLGNRAHIKGVVFNVGLIGVVIAVWSGYKARAGMLEGASNRRII
ncbi:hypothetical protein Syun_031926 [Stephania yunnanensis]|uniref:Uncharacterized protein n=1 Tax=Stephania yunnanensis TaxID=152371 RepID=A0AAP0DTJ7_9MAGN